MNKYIFKVRLCDGFEANGNVTVVADSEDMAYDMALLYVCERLRLALPELDIEVSVDLDEEKMLDENTKELIEKIEEAKQYCKGELELDLFDNDEYGYGWYAMDYREDLEAAFPIDNNKYDKPLIAEEFAESYNINVRKCCDLCDIYYVG